MRASSRSRSTPGPGRVVCEPAAATPSSVVRSALRRPFRYRRNKEVRSRPEIEHILLDASRRAACTRSRDSLQVQREIFSHFPKSGVLCDPVRAVTWGELERADWGTNDRSLGGSLRMVDSKWGRWTCLRWANARVMNNRD